MGDSSNGYSYDDFERMMRRLMLKERGYDPRDGLQPVVPKGTVVIGRRFRANQRQGLRQRNRKRDSGEEARPA